jgi:hypothetical protein
MQRHHTEFCNSHERLINVINPSIMLRRLLLGTEYLPLTLNRTAPAFGRRSGLSVFNPYRT